jgi:hypothetical protein
MRPQRSTFERESFSCGRSGVADEDVWAEHLEPASAWRRWQMRILQLGGPGTAIADNPWRRRPNGNTRTILEPRLTTRILLVSR